MVVCLGLWALYQALHTQSVLQKTLYAYTIYSAALTPVVLAAFYSRRANAAGAVSAIGVGTFVTVFWDTDFIHHHLPAGARPAGRHLPCADRLRLLPGRGQRMHGAAAP